MHRVSLALFVLLAMSIRICQAEIGGSILWTATIAEWTNAGELSPDGKIHLIGDDGVVVVSARGNIYEIVPNASGQPVVSLASIQAERPDARVAGRTFTYGGSRLQWINPNGTVGVLPDGPRVFAFTADADIYSFERVGEDNSFEWALTKRSVDGQILFAARFGKTSELPRKLIIGSQGTVFFSTGSSFSNSRLFAFSPEGRLLWSTNLGDEVEAPIPLVPTTAGGIWVVDRRGILTRLTEDGFPDKVLTMSPPFDNRLALSPSDEPLAPGALVGLELSAWCGLADGGAVRSSTKTGDGQYPLMWIIRTSAIGSTLWVKEKDQGLLERTGGFLLGNGVGYFCSVRRKTKTVQETVVTAVDLGAPVMDSAWPFTKGWPDGSNRARPRSYAPPTVTMIGKPRHSGAVIEFGVEDDLRYTVESADKPDGPWRSVGTVTGAGYGARFTDPTSVGDPMRLYRVKRSQ